MPQTQTGESQCPILLLTIPILSLEMVLSLCVSRRQTKLRLFFLTGGNSDARRPCSTCVRSHAHAVAHAHAGTEIPAYPECTFDDGHINSNAQHVAEC